MAGMFDDLVPATGSGLKFDDLMPKRSFGDDVTGFMSKVNRGLVVGDEIAAGLATARDIVTGRSGPDVVQTYKDEMGRQRQTEDSFAAAHPNVAAFATGTGNALTMAVPIGPGAEAFATGGRVVNALRGGTVGALTAAGYSAVDRGSPEERLRAASDPLTLGAGAALGGAAGALGGARRTPAEPAPTLEGLTQRKNDAYDAVGASGHRYDPEDLNSLFVNMADKMDQEGFHAGLHSKAAVMLDKIGAAVQARGGYAPSLSELDQLRQQIGRDVASSSDPGERRMGTIMRNEIDGFIKSKGDGNKEILEARNLNTRVEKLRSLDNLDEAAADRASVTGSGGNINNATRQNVLRFKSNTNNLTPDEHAAAQRVIDGTRAGNALRQVGKLSPEGNGLAALGHSSAAITELALGHGHLALGQTGLALTGAIAKRAADAITARNVQALRDIIARGGKKAAQEVDRQLIAAGADDLRSQLANDLAVAGGVQGASRRHAVEVSFPDHPERGVGASRR